MSCSEHYQSNENSVIYYSFLALILESTRITSHCNTLIENTFLNVIEPDKISGNLATTISNHLPQSALIPNMFCNNWSNLIFMKTYVANLFKKNEFLATFLLTGRKLMNYIFITQMYLDNINMLLDSYVTLKRVNKHKLKFKSKP